MLRALIELCALCGRCAALCAAPGVRQPTGELVSNNARSIFALFREMVEEQGISVVAATHDSTLLAMADSVKEMKDGSMVEGSAESSRYRN